MGDDNKAGKSAELFDEVQMGAIGAANPVGKLVSVAKLLVVVSR